MVWPEAASRPFVVLSGGFVVDGDPVVSLHHRRCWCAEIGGCLWLSVVSIHVLVVGGRSIAWQADEGCSWP